MHCGIFTLDLSLSDGSATQPEWISRDAEVRVRTNPKTTFPAIARFRLATGPTELYRYYPFTCWVQSGDGVDLEILEFTKPHQEHFLDIPLPEGHTQSLLRFQTECGGRPSQLGLSEDERDLSLQLSFAGWEAPSQRPAYGLVADPERTRLVENPRYRRKGGGPTERYRRKFAADISQEPQPTFIIGSYRSGTSALTWAIGQHPDIFAMEETTWLPPIAMATHAAYRMADGAARSPNQVYDVGPRELSGSVATAMHELFLRNSRYASLRGRANRKSGDGANFPNTQRIGSQFSPKRQWVDGTPEYAHYAHILSEFFPHARFVGVLRDPDEVVRSLLNFEGLSGRVYDVQRSIAVWEALTRSTIEAAMALGPDRMVLLPFDAMVSTSVDCLDEVWELLDQPRFAPASRVFSQRINSSFRNPPDHSAEPASDMGDEIPELAQLRSIYRELLAGAPPDSLPWLAPLRDWGAHSNHVISRVMHLFGG